MGEDQNPTPLEWRLEHGNAEHWEKEANVDGKGNWLYKVKNISRNAPDFGKRHKTKKLENKKKILRRKKKRDSALWVWLRTKELLKRKERNP